MSGFSFASPLLLAALAGLPLIWLVLRQSPPPPRRIKLPSIKLLLPEDIPPPQAARPPWWLLLLRLFIAALLIAALAGPRWQPQLTADIPARLTIVFDNGWAAMRWPEMKQAALRRIDALSPAGTRFAIIDTAASRDVSRSVAFVDAETARAQIGALNASPWQTNRAAAARLVEGGTPALWLSDGFDSGGAKALAAAVGTGEIALYPSVTPVFLTAGQAGSGWAVRLVRPPGTATEHQLTAQSANGSVITSTPVNFDSQTASARIRIAAARRGEVARLSTGGSAAATYLADGSNARPRAVVIDGSSDTPPLESGDFYIRRALEPHAEIARASLATAAADDARIFFLSDIAASDAAAVPLLERVRNGSVVVSFAGPRMAENGSALSPVALRSGARAMGGVMTWQKPQTVGSFAAGTPLAGLPRPQDATVSKQLLTRGDTDGAEVWATLSDETPLVTARRVGDGLLILFHFSADPSWSNLPLSGLFETMIVRLLPLAADASALDLAAESPWRLERELAADGALADPSTPVEISPEDWEAAKAGPQTPPGIYRSGDVRRALNLTSRLGSGFRFRPLDPGQMRPAAEIAAPIDIGRWLLLAGLALLAADIVVALALRGRLLAFPRGAPALAAMAALMIPLMLAAPASAQQQERLQIAYIGGTSADAQIAAGLSSLSLALRRRTSVDPGQPQPIDAAAPGMGRYPLVYWPAYAKGRINAAEAANLRDYLSRGGMVLFDFGRPLGANSGAKELLAPLGLPALAESGREHVLWKSYYLLGSVGGGALWVESGTDGDSGAVSGVAIGGGNWPSLWAASTAAPPSEREAALRFGINLVMYALTGTYKADQVHAETLLGRISER